MKNIHYYILAAAVAAGSAVEAQAQNVAKQDTTMNKVMVIENEYIPQISEAEKINVVPEVKAPQVSAKKVEYATASSPSSNIPSGTMNPILARELQPDATKGYVRVGFGNYGNLDLFGNYLLTIGQRDRVNFNFTTEGMNGKLKTESGDKWKAKFYRIRGGVDYTHQFDALDLNIAAGGGATILNNLPFYGYEPENQKMKTGEFLAGVKSTEDDADFSYKASTNYIYFNRKELYSEYTQTEHRVRTMGEIGGKISEEQAITIGAEMNNIIYNASEKENALTNYTTVDFNPYYSLTNDSWMLRAGANVDLSFGAGKKVQVSPDVNINYTFADSYVVYLNATGGRRINDFRQLESVNPYATILWDSNVQDTYEQLNGEIGVKGSPVGGFHFNVRGGYQKLNNDNFSYYIAYSNAETAYGNPTTIGHADTYNAFAGLDLSYDYRSKVAASASLLYRNWSLSDSSNDKGMLLFHPELEMNVALTVKPINKLMVELSYLYEKRKKIEGYNKINPVSDLCLHAEYEFYKGISIYANVNNILNKQYQFYLGQSTEGFNFLGGLSFRF